jgi:Zn-dependent peptidase ImmA (M78 family)/transcriptional regulator with XRE-family HTH domain
MREFNSEMLVLAREFLGVTQSQLAFLMGMSQAEISKIESGIRKPTDDDLVARLAKHLQCPEEFFYISDSMKNFGSACVYHRKRQSTTQGMLTKLLALVNKRRIQVKRLLCATEVPDNLFPRMDIDDFAGGAGEVARALRAAWKLAPGPIQNLTKAVEDAGGIVIRCDFGSNKVDAVSQWFVDAPPLFFVNEAIPADRMRFSLAHEIGHIVMHQLPTKDMEREADRFAAEFLMPQAQVSSHLQELSLPKLASLKPYWKVSMAALLYRAAELKIITERTKSYLWFRMGQAKYRTQEPVQIPQEFPALLSELIDLHRNELGYSVSDLAQLLLTTEEEVRRVFIAKPSGLQLLSK